MVFKKPLFLSLFLNEVYNPKNLNRLVLHTLETPNLMETSSPITGCSLVITTNVVTKSIELTVGSVLVS